MDDPRAVLLGRLDAIAGALAGHEGTLALIGLGSVGADLDRLDRHSDLDFFVIVEPGWTETFIGNLDWLAEAAPIAFAFQNTADGSKVLFEDGVYAEFAVFDPARLRSIPFDGPRIVWHRGGFDLGPLLPNRPPATPPTVQWLLGEILTNLLVGLMRLQRGETLAAQRLIQVHAVDRLLEIWPTVEHPAHANRDPFDRSRRVEQRFPGIPPHLSRFSQGYDRNCESALAILAFLQDYFALNAAIVERIEVLAADSRTSSRG